MNDVLPFDAGQVGARPETADTSTYLEVTRTVPSKGGPVRLPSDRWTGGQALTREEWLRKFADAHPKKAFHPSEPEFWA